jgi:hypothetical protein
MDVIIRNGSIVNVAGMMKADIGFARRSDMSVIG